MVHFIPPTSKQRVDYYITEKSPWVLWFKKIGKKWGEIICLFYGGFWSKIGKKFASRTI